MTMQIMRGPVGSGTSEGETVAVVGDDMAYQLLSVLGAGMPGGHAYWAEPMPDLKTLLLRDWFDDGSELDRVHPAEYGLDDVEAGNRAAWVLWSLSAITRGEEAIPGLEDCPYPTTAAADRIGYFLDCEAGGPTNAAETIRAVLAARPELFDRDAVLAKFKVVTGGVDYGVVDACQFLDVSFAADGDDGWMMWLAGKRIK